MNHEPECPWAGQPDDDKCPTCNLLRMGYKRGREDAAQDAERVLGAKHNELIDAILKHGYNCDCQVGGVDAMSIDTDWLRRVADDLFQAVTAASGADPYQSDTKSPTSPKT